MIIVVQTFSFIKRAVVQFAIKMSLIVLFFSIFFVKVNINKNISIIMIECSIL